VALLLLSGAARAEKEKSPPKDDGNPPSLPDDTTDALPAPEPAVPESVEDRLAALEDELARVKQELEEQKQAQKPSPISFFGYADFGFFVPRGSGVGWIQDVGNKMVPRLAGQYGWVFLGDILSTAVNSRGEAADLGSAPGINRFDSVSSKGAPGFILNEVAVGLNAALGSRLSLSTVIDFVPRTGSDFALGDFFNVDTAQLEWVVDEAQTTSVFAGKIDPVFGIEYKDRRADQRFGVTPSLISRYTTGPELGVKFRSRLFSDWLILAAAVTNGSSTVEQFMFYDEIDSNAGKTEQGRVALRLPIGELLDIGPDSLEIGFSEEYGAQDRARDNSGALWFVGVDLTYWRPDFSIKAQWIRGMAPGSEIDRAYELDLKGSGYVELNWMILTELGILVRAEMRDAFVGLDPDRAYLTKSWRVTAGARLVLSHHVILKAEYLRNGEFGEVPEFQNDVFTSSLVLRY
jgi:hypothetical protein